jgi:hypothetical protein
METFDSHGQVLPIGAADQGMVSKKVSDKDGQGQTAHGRLKKKAAPPPVPEEEAEPQSKNHLIDIVV